MEPAFATGSLLPISVQVHTLIQKGGENMDCGHKHHHGDHCGCGGRRHHHGDFCGCGTPFHGGRRFWTKEEQIARLERYLEGLEKEAQAVKEQIAEMTGEG
jgi:hypothetical protein